MQRDSMVFYRSFMEATDSLEPIQYKNVFQMLLHYAMDGKQPEEEGIEYSLFSLMKPQIDANNRKYENGKKGAEFGKLGGRPKKERTCKPQKKPKETPNVNENGNVNDNKHIYGAYHHVRLTDEEYNRLLTEYGQIVLDDYIRRLDEYIQQTGKKYKDHNLTIRNWIRKESEKNGSCTNAEQTAEYAKIGF